MIGGLTGLPAFADIADDVVSELRSMGYDEISVERTLLGRVKIEAEGAAGEREIIVNPRTGEILRDLFIRAQDGSSGRLLRDDDDACDVNEQDGDCDPDDGGGSGRDGGDDDRDDDGRDDDDNSNDDDDSDNSGSGSDDSDDSSGSDDD